MRSSVGPGAFRLFLACLVVISHVLPVETGRVAVAAFFALSGYWVVRNYRQSYQSSGASVLGFYIARALRIFPIYYVSLLFALGLLSAIGSAEQVHLYDWTLFTLFPAPDRVLKPAWSLNIELQFYLLVPVLCWALGTAPTNRRLVLLAVGAALSSLLFFSLSARVEQSVLCYALPFTLGGIAAYRPNRISDGAAWGSALFFCLATVAMAVVPAWRWMIFRGSLGGEDLLGHDAVSVIWSLLAMPFVLWTVQRPSGPTDRTFGELAYTLYLAHWVLVTHDAEIFGRYPVHGVSKAMALVSSAVAAVLLYAAIDRPLERLRRRLFHAAPGPKEAQTGDKKPALIR